MRALFLAVCALLAAAAAATTIDYDDSIALMTDVARRVCNTGKIMYAFSFDDKAAADSCKAKVASLAKDASLYQTTCDEYNFISVMLGAIAQDDPSYVYLTGAGDFSKVSAKMITPGQKLDVLVASCDTLAVTDPTLVIFPADGSGDPSDDWSSSCTAADDNVFKVEFIVPPSISDFCSLSDPAPVSAADIEMLVVACVSLIMTIIILVFVCVRRQRAVSKTFTLP